MGSYGLISIITPTYNRPAFLNRLKAYVLAQTHADFEWLILDDSPEPNVDFAAITDRRIRYIHVPIRSTLGAKRNELVAMSMGQYIVQCDDDDYYRPDYLAHTLKVVSESGADIVNLSGWFLLDLRWNFFGYWNLLKKDGLHYCCDKDGVRALVFGIEDRDKLKGNEFGYGFTYAFKRRVWEACSFPDIDMGEDSSFFLAARDRFRSASIPDEHGLCLHILHRGSTSRSFPQYRLPTFLLGKLFPKGVICCRCD